MFIEMQQNNVMIFTKKNLLFPQGIELPTPWPNYHNGEGEDSKLLVTTVVTPSVQLLLAFELVKFV